MTAPAQANSPARALIRVSCPDGAPQLCEALIRAIDDSVMTGAVVRQVARGAEAPAGPGDIGIALHMDTVSDSALAGHLAWQTAAGPMQDGPDLRMDQLDSPMNASGYKAFAERLLQASSGIAAALR